MSRSRICRVPRIRVSKQDCNKQAAIGGLNLRARHANSISTRNDRTLIKSPAGAKPAGLFYFDFHVDHGLTMGRSPDSQQIDVRGRIFTGNPGYRQWHRCQLHLLCGSRPTSPPPRLTGARARQRRTAVVDPERRHRRPCRWPAYFAKPLAAAICQPIFAQYIERQPWAVVGSSPPGLRPVERRKPRSLRSKQELVSISRYLL